MTPISIFWFRRDLRLHDNAGLYHALRGKYPVLPLFIFDTEILDDLEDRTDARVAFIHRTITTLKAELEAMDSSLIVKHGKPIDVWQQLSTEYDIQAVYTNHDYEPYTLMRDEAVRTFLSKKNIELHTYKDHVIFEKNEVTKDDGLPYTVFTPYSRKWRKKMNSRISTFINAKGNEEAVSFYLKSYPNEKYFNNFHKITPLSHITLSDMNFVKSEMAFPPESVSQGLIKKYSETRNFPAINGTSRLGIHFRFGTISIRAKARKALMLNNTYLNELIWRDFYAQILSHFPHVVTQPFRAKYDAVQWRNNEADFEQWCVGKTGYPIVDAGMRELNATGYMHNRVRMITASFLTKHLLIDWRWGEGYFAKKLLDFDLASNNGGWQWAAGCGTDAAPYFRIFNPTSQQQKFDKEFKYIKKWVSEFGTPDYPMPMVDHKFARERCLKTYKDALSKV